MTSNRARLYQLALALRELGDDDLEDLRAWAVGGADRQRSPRRCTSCGRASCRRARAGRGVRECDEALTTVADDANREDMVRARRRA